MLKKTIAVIGLCATTLVFPTYAEATTVCELAGGSRHHATEVDVAQQMHHPSDSSKQFGAIPQFGGLSFRRCSSYRRPAMFASLAISTAGFAAVVGQFERIMHLSRWLCQHAVELTAAIAF